MYEYNITFKTQSSNAAESEYFENMKEAIVRMIEIKDNSLYGNSGGYVHIFDNDNNLILGWVEHCNGAYVTGDYPLENNVEMDLDCDNEDCTDGDYCTECQQSMLDICSTRLAEESEGN
jgi:hypothetical protein